jgi:hypothetical protein
MVARSAVAGALAIIMCGATPVAAAAATPPPVTAEPSERVTATVHPALVRVTGRFVGRVHNREGSYANGGRPYSFTITCSGFGVHPDGFLASSGHCVDANDRTIRGAFIRAAAEEALGNRTDMTLEQMIAHGTSAWAIEGEGSGSPVQSEIRVSGTPGAPPEGLLARVVDDRPITQGDVALLKVDAADIPTLELATDAGLAVGTPVRVAGFPKSLGEIVRPDAQPSIGNGTVTEDGVDGGRPAYKIDAPMEAGLSGGPAVDDSGRVLGINSLRTRGAIVMPISGFTDLLRRNGVTAELGPRDRLYREALDAYYAGEYTDALEGLPREGALHPRMEKLRTDAGTARDVYGDASENRLRQILVWVGVAVVLVAVVIAVVLVVRGQRSRRPVGFGPAPYPPFPGPPHGPPHGPPWQAGPAAPFPAPPMAAPGPPHHPPYHPFPAVGGPSDRAET